MSLENAPISIKSAPAAPQTSTVNTTPNLKQVSFLEKIFSPKGQGGNSGKEEEKEEKKLEKKNEPQQQKRISELDDALTDEQKKENRSREIRLLSNKAVKIMNSAKNPNECEALRCNIVQKLWEKHLESTKK